MAEWWDNPRTVFRYPALRQLAILGNPGLRGITDLCVTLDYPLTVICGKNGSGKSTILALAALAFHSPENHLPLNALRHPHDGENFTYYTFRDFFFRGPGDPDITGLSITWSYNGAPQLSIRKQSEKWMHYERRPKRPVHYLGILRSVPAAEQTVLRSHFPARQRHHQQQVLNADYRRYLSHLMGRTYEDATALQVARYSVRRANAGAQYSSFNMGAGEDILIDLLLLLQNCPVGSLIVIEEIELGLHPEALTKLAGVLQEVMWAKKLQVIVSTHSEHFLDACPNQARQLVQRLGGAHHLITAAPTTRYAMGYMLGTPEYEMNIYCEDDFAAEVITAGLSGTNRRKCKIIPVGSNSELCSAVKFHHTAGIDAHHLVAWDGDVTDADIGTWSRSAQLENFNFIRLPGGLPPEKWLIAALDCPQGVGNLAAEVKLEPDETRVLLEALKAVPKAHDIVHTMHTITGNTRENCIRYLISAVSRLDPNPLASLDAVVEAVLAGGHVAGGLQQVAVVQGA